MRQAENPRRPARDDLGSGFTEYAALILLVAAVLAAVAMAAIPDSVRSQLESALCMVEKAAGLSDGDCTLESDDEDIADTPDPEDFIPQLCQRGAMYEASSFNVKIIGTFESETTIKRIELADGSVWYIAQPANKSAGLELGAGATLNVKDGFTSNRTLHGAASYDWGQGQIWTFPPDQQEAADEFEEQLRDETSIGSNPVTALWDDVFGGEPDLRDPQMELDVKGGSAEGSVSYDTGIALDDLADEQGGRELDFGQGVHGDLGLAYQNIVRTDRRNPDDVITSTTNQITGSIGGGGKVMLGVGGTGDATWTSGVRDDRDENGNLRGIFLNASFDRSIAMDSGMPFGFTKGNLADAGPDANVNTDINRTVDKTYVYVKIDNEEERQAGEAFLDTYGGPVGPARYFAESVAGNHGYFEEEPGSDAEPWADLFYDKAQVWQSSHDKEHTDWEIGGSARYKLFTFGGGYGEEEHELTTRDAWYLGAPGEDGTRETIRYDDCIADE